MTSAPLTAARSREATAPASGALRWLPAYLVVALIWGSSYLFIKVGVRELHPLHLTLGRVVFGCLTLLTCLAVTRSPLPGGLALWAHLAVVAAVGVVVPFTLFGYAEQRISSGLAGIWNATTPLVALPLAVLVFRTERMTLRRAVGLGLGFAGVLVILGVWHGVGGTNLTGQVMCFIAALGYGIVIPYQRRFLAGRPESGLTIATGQVIMAAVLLGIAAPLLAGWPPAPSTLSIEVLASVMMLGAFGTGIAFVLQFRVIRVAGATTAATVTYLIPVVATVIGVVALGEDLTWYQPVGAAIVLLGVAISQGVRLPRRRAGWSVRASRPTRAASERARS